MLEQIGAGKTKENTYEELRTENPGEEALAWRGPFGGIPWRRAIGQL